eukprot:6197971-Pleurochrysis_carterae.AAC.1
MAARLPPISPTLTGLSPPRSEGVAHLCSRRCRRFDRVTWFGHDHLVALRHRRRSLRRARTRARLHARARSRSRTHAHGPQGCSRRRCRVSEAARAICARQSGDRILVAEDSQQTHDYDHVPVNGMCDSSTTLRKEVRKCEACCPACCQAVDSRLCRKEGQRAPSCAAMS